MQQITQRVGAALVAVGTFSYIVSGGSSVTALIPVPIGVALVALAAAGRNPARRSTMAHVAAALGLIGFLGSLRVFGAIPGFMNATGDVSGIAIGAQLAVLSLCGYHTVAAVRSFRAARAGTAASA